MFCHHHHDFFFINAIIQGPNWKKKLVDKEEDEVVLNGSHAAGETECKKVADDSVDCSECPPTFSAADNVEEACATDELRPSKKAKSIVDEMCSDEVENGSFVDFIFLLIFPHISL